MRLICALRQSGIHRVGIELHVLNPPFTVSGWGKPHPCESVQLSAARFRPSRFNGKDSFCRSEPAIRVGFFIIFWRSHYTASLVLRPTYSYYVRPAHYVCHSERSEESNSLIVGRNAPHLRTPPKRLMPIFYLSE